MRRLPHLFESNRRWAEAMNRSRPGFFTQLAAQQTPRYLWIGCSDSRVPANQIVDLDPGQLFVHRNVANLVIHTDFSCLSVLQFAVDILRVEHVIVCGHYGCGGVAAAWHGDPLGLIDNWLRHIQEIALVHRPELLDLPGEAERVDRLCEINVIEQALNVCQTTVVREAWRRGQSLAVHAWIYGLHDGLLRDLDFCAGGLEDLREEHLRALRSRPK